MNLQGESPAPLVDPAGVLRAKLDLLRKAVETEGPPDYRRRREHLDALARGIKDGREALIAAVAEDFGGRSRHETIFLEIIPLLDQIRHARKRLHRWMRLRRASVGFQFLPGRALVFYQPLGVVGILGTWNYPLLLTLSPLVYALAAGNRALLKPSEVAPRTASAVQEMLARSFREDQVDVVTGGVEVSAAFSSLPFDHLIFTGSGGTGMLVLRAASENLTPVTLELGGKS